MPFEPAHPPHIPLTEVKNMDSPGDRPRLIRFPAREAVLWCMAMDLDIEERLAPAVLGERLLKVGDSWVCGPYVAKEGGRWPKVEPTPGKK